MHVREWVRGDVSVSVYLYLCMFMYVCMYVCVCMYLRVHLHVRVEMEECVFEMDMQYEHIPYADGVTARPTQFI